MWNLWYITFVFLFLTIIALLVGIILQRKENKYYNLCESTEKDIRESRDWKKITELEKLKEEYKKIYRNTTPRYGWCSAVCAGVLSFFLLITCILFPLQARKEVNYFIAKKEYVEMAIANGSELENVAITQIVIEQNHWLANAKASAQTYGAWSVYYGIDFSDLSPIEIKRGN